MILHIIPIISPGFAGPDNLTCAVADALCDQMADYVLANLGWHVVNKGFVDGGDVVREASWTNLHNPFPVRIVWAIFRSCSCQTSSLLWGGIEKGLLIIVLNLFDQWPCACANLLPCSLNRRSSSLSVVNWVVRQHSGCHSCRCLHCGVNWMASETQSQTWFILRWFSSTRCSSQEILRPSKTTETSRTKTGGWLLKIPFCMWLIVIEW